MSKQINGFITWIRTFLDDIYAPKGSGGSDLDIDLVPKSENDNGIICFSGGLTYDLDKVYPIGSIYMSVNSTSPSTLFGGTWVQLTDTFLYATSTTADTGTTTATGGSATVSLTKAQMPRHTHTQNSHNHQLPNSAIVYSSSYSGAIPNGTAKQYGTNTQAKLDTNSATATNQYTGGTSTAQSEQNGSPHENMPPYMKVYMWKRTE